MKTIKPALLIILSLLLAIGTADMALAQQANFASTVRVNSLANLEALLNIIANGCYILGIPGGGPLCYAVPVGIVFLFIKNKRRLGLFLVLLGPCLLIIEVATPVIINHLVASARDAGWFN